MMNMDNRDLEAPLSPVPVQFNRGRRWSLDIITPKRLLPSKRSSVSSGEKNVKPDLMSTLMVPRSPSFKINFSKSNQRRNPFHFQRRGKHDPKIKVSFFLLDMGTPEQTLFTFEDENDLKPLLQLVLLDQRVRSYRVIMPSTRLITKMELEYTRRVFSKSCQDLTEINRDDEEDDDVLIADSDPRHRLVADLLAQEQGYCRSLQTLLEVYVQPLSQLPWLSMEDHQILFLASGQMFSLSQTLLKNLQDALVTWDSHTTCLGNLFSAKFWNCYQEYYQGYEMAKRLLLEKQDTDSSFKEFCWRSHEQGRQPLEDLLALSVIVSKQM